MRGGEGRPATDPTPNTINAAIVTLDGQRALVILTDVPDDAPEAVKEGVARRNIVNLGGVCPCGATMPPKPNRAQRRAGILHLAVVHEDDCPACDDTILEAIRGWKR